MERPWLADRARARERVGASAGSGGADFAVEIFEGPPVLEEGAPQHEERPEWDSTPYVPPPTEDAQGTEADEDEHDAAPLGRERRPPPTAPAAPAAQPHSRGPARTAEASAERLRLPLALCHRLALVLEHPLACLEVGIGVRAAHARRVKLLAAGLELGDLRARRRELGIRRLRLAPELDVPLGQGAHLGLQL
jgi:hypothetical protein